MDAAQATWLASRAKKPRTKRVRRAWQYLRPVPVLDQVVVRRAGVLTWLDADTLAEVDGPPGLPAVDSTVVTFSPDGSLAAVLEDGWVNVHHLTLHRLAALADRPLGATTPADLDAVTGVLDRALPDAPAGPILELLRVCLEHRFGADVTLGSGDRLAGVADDIALGGST